MGSSPVPPGVAMIVGALGSIREHRPRGATAARPSSDARPPQAVRVGRARGGPRAYRGPTYLSRSTRASCSPSPAPERAIFVRTLLAGFALASAAGAALADPCEGPLPKPGQSFAGQVRYVGDGDSLCVGSSSDPATWVEVRVENFYAPELNAPGGQEAKATLQRLVMGRTVQCRAGRRSYDRIVARCSLGGRTIGELMRRAGVREGGNGR